MSDRSKFRAELESAGFRIVNKVDRWYEVLTPLPFSENACVYKQNAHAYHCFFEFEGTASGFSAATCHKGGLGDAIETDGEIRSYKRIVLNAPRKLMKKYDGLYRASSCVFNG